MKISSEMVVEQVDTTLDGRGEEAVGFFAAVERNLAAIAMPKVSWSAESGDTGFLRALLGNRRDFLRVQHSRFREYSVVVFVRTCGSLLRASMLVIASPRFANDVRRALRLGGGAGRFELGAEFDLFDTIDLADFVAVTRLAFSSAVREFRRLDPTSDSDSGSGFDPPGADDSA